MAVIEALAASFYLSLSLKVNSSSFSSSPVVPPPRSLISLEKMIKEHGKAHPNNTANNIPQYKKHLSYLEVDLWESSQKPILSPVHSDSLAPLIFSGS